MSDPFVWRAVGQHGKAWDDFEAARKRVETAAQAPSVQTVVSATDARINTFLDAEAHARRALAARVKVLEDERKGRL